MSDLEIRHNKEGYSYDLVGKVEGGEITFASVNAGSLRKTEGDETGDKTGESSEPETPAEGIFPQSTSEAISGEPSETAPAPQV